MLQSEFGGVWLDGLKGQLRGWVPGQEEVVPRQRSAVGRVHIAHILPHLKITAIKFGILFLHSAICIWIGFFSTKIFLQYHKISVFFANRYKYQILIIYKKNSVKLLQTTVPVLYC